MSFHKMSNQYFDHEFIVVPYEKISCDFYPKNVQLKFTTFLLRFLYDSPYKKCAKFCNKSHGNHMLKIIRFLHIFNIKILQLLYGWKSYSFYTFLIQKYYNNTYKNTIKIIIYLYFFNSIKQNIISLFISKK